MFMLMSPKRNNPHLFDRHGLSQMSREYLETEIENLRARNEALERQIVALVKRQARTQESDDEDLHTRH